MNNFKFQEIETIDVASWRHIFAWVVAGVVAVVLGAAIVICAFST